jgi:hypothetical protein
MTTTRSRARVARALALAAIVLVSAVRLPYAAVHMDLARDVFIAWRSLHGEALPMNGPVLAGAIHLGPVWYWLLTGLLAIARGWSGTMLLLGLIAGAQFPLAYLVGKELYSRRAGLLWAVGLLVPCWGTFEWLLPLHYLLSSACVLAFALCALRYWRRPRRRYLAGVALAFVLAVHAHPANAGLAFVGLALLGWAIRNRHCSVADLAVAALVALLPLLPYFAWDGANGFADIRSGLRFIGGEHTGHFGAAWPLLVATAIGGTSYWFSVMLGWPAWAASSAVAVIGLASLAGLAGAIAAAIAPATRAAALALFGATAAILVTIALLRDMTPYYMTTPLHVALTGIVAFGLATLGFGVLATAAQAGNAAVAAIAFALVTSAGIHWQKHGDLPFNFIPLFVVAEAPQPTAPLLLMPAYGVAASGAFLCAQPAPSAHGVLAQYLLHGYAIDMRLACGRGDAKLGGDDAARSHWLGLSRAMLKQIGVAAQRRLGSIGIVAAHPRTPGPAIDPPALPVYPAYMPSFSAAPQERRLRIDCGADRHVAVSNIAFGFAPNPQVAVTQDARPLAALAQDSVSSVYACGDGGAGATVDIVFSSLDANDVDVVTF